jgi:hypothetical protein
LLTSDRAMVSRRFIPPDSSSTLTFAFSVSATNSSNSSDRLRDSARLRPKYRP